MHSRNKHNNKSDYELRVFWPLKSATKIATNQMNNDLVITLHDVNNYDASMDQNKPMGGNQSYLGMNSMA